MTLPQLDIVRDALLAFTSTTRLYELTIDNVRLQGELLVEAFAAVDGVQEIGHRDVIVLATSAHINLQALLGKPATLHISLADRSRIDLQGLISRAASLGSNGGLARYRLRLTPWLFQLTLVRNSRVWENRSVIEIVDAVLQPYPHAQWRWSDDVSPFMAEAPPRSYCCQYRESDFDFVKRVLTEEGLAWRFEDGEDGHQMVIFADSSALSATPNDPSSAVSGGIRYHGARAAETSDAVQSLSTGRSLIPSHSSLLSYDYKSKKIIVASEPTKQPGGKRLPLLEHFDAPGQYAFANASQARRYAVIYAEALEARASRWTMRSTVRTLRAGTRFTLLNSPLARDGAHAYAVLRVRSVGINNLPTPAVQALAELFGPLPDLLQEAMPDAEAEFLDSALIQAMASGYANWFEAIEASVPWRPLHIDSAGKEHSHHRPTAMGSQSAERG
jgi:type VI secretion system secreted protein VgrG